MIIPDFQYIVNAQNNAVCKVYTDFPYYPKVENSCETFHKLKWHKGKNIPCFPEVHVKPLRFSKRPA